MSEAIFKYPIINKKFAGLLAQCEGEVLALQKINNKQKNP
jgi:hypothetical protein